MDRVLRDKLKWRCRRGLLELELVLQSYLGAHPEDARLMALLDLPDNDLWDIVAGRSDAYDPRLTETVARLRATQCGAAATGAA